MKQLKSETAGSSQSRAEAKNTESVFRSPMRFLVELHSAKREAVTATEYNEGFTIDQICQYGVNL
jgi:hypothetical protein